MAHNYLFFMVKYPRMGRVKTRLGRGLGFGRSVNIYRKFLSGLLRKISVDPRWETILAISPDETMSEACWPSHLMRTPQGEGDLGQRMGRIMGLAPSGSVVIVGADCPYINASDINKAFICLKKNDVVLGPSEDGGYWLVGQKGLKRPDIFREVRWSTKHTLKDTEKNCQGLKLARLRVLRDIDEMDDYRVWLTSSSV